MVLIPIKKYNINDKALYFFPTYDKRNLNISLYFRYNCSICGDIFVSEYDVMEHKSTEHSGQNNATENPGIN